MRPSILLAGIGLDAAIGDPEWLPHPVRLIGAAISQGERLMYPKRRSPTRELVAGATLTAGTVGLAYSVTAGLLAAASAVSPRAGWALEVWLTASCLATRNLYDEAMAVLQPLHDNDVSLARARLARIVGRDTVHLDSSEISRALIETLAESTCDGVVGPLFYLALGGVPLAMAFKAVSTLDSMVGNTSERYFYFGKVAARLDDAANFLPARIAACCIAVSAGLCRGASLPLAVRTWLVDGQRHKSPNSGRPEAAMAGALRIRLGGANVYAGEQVTAPYLGQAFPAPNPDDAHKALRITVLAGAAASLGALCIAAVLHSRKRRP